MTLTALDGFRSLETHHCITGSMLHVYDYHDHRVSEEMLLGLGAGVGFMYWHQKGIPPMYGGRSNMARPGVEGLEIVTSRRLGVAAERFHTGSERKAQKTLINLLEAGEPVMIHVDMGFLPYFDFPDDYHFGGHTVVVCGCDAESEQVLIADRDNELHAMTLEELAQARGSTFKPFPPMNTWYTYDFSQKHPPTAEAVRLAICEGARGMLEPPISNFGVEGIRKAAKRTRKWPEIMSEDELRWTCFNIYIFIDATGGTGGGIFRYMYGRFLREAAEIAGESGLAEIGEEMREIGDRWQEVAGIFHEAQAAPNPAEYLPEATAIIETIADREQAAWESLRQITV